MKKGIILVAMMAACAVAVSAQPRAIGGRLGAFEGVSYEHGFGDNNMLEVELGWGFGSRVNGGSRANGTNWWLWGHNIQAAVTYDWIDPFGATFPWDHKGEWHWYMGVGGAGGYGWSGYSRAEVGGIYIGDWYRRNWGFLGAAGRIGVEYDFWFPLQLSIDWRPTLGLGLVDRDANGQTYAGFYWEVTSLSLGVRYKF